MLGIIAGALWVGLVLLGGAAWSRSRRSGGAIGESVKTLLAGFWLPATFIGYGFWGTCALRTWLFDRALRLVEIKGSAAVALGLAWICIGGCIHCIVVWRLHPRLSRYADPAALVIAIGAVVAALLGFWWML